MIRFLSTLLLVLFSIQSRTQTILSGQVRDALNGQPIAFSTVQILQTQRGVVADEQGVFKFENLTPGIYNFKASFVGYASLTLFEIEVLPNKNSPLVFELQQINTELKEVVIEQQAFERSIVSPLSKRTIGVAEIQRSAGGNRDISKVIQNLPGVASTPSFRNDIIIRGGAPNENRFYLDGIEVSNINHFATQGSSGGPVGMLNVNLIRNVDYFSSAFSAARGNALSSVFEFKQKLANKEKLKGTFLLGSSDAGITLEGPLSERSTFLFSARRSYLQFLFAALKLPFLPTYNDAQFKYNLDLNDKNKLTILGLGAIDDFVLNQQANDGVTDSITLKRNNYALGNIPVNSQWNYAIGAVYTHFGNDGYQNFVVSRNQLQNKAIKYSENIEVDENLLFDYNSSEIENKFRYEHHLRKAGFKLLYGLALQHARYTNTTFDERIVINGQNQTFDYSSELNLVSYAPFFQLSKNLLDERLGLAFGLRADANNYNDQMRNLFKQLSPRFSASFMISDQLSINFSTGRYTQLPAYTVLGFQQQQAFVNQSRTRFIQSDHLVSGLEFRPYQGARMTLEGFYKHYNDYPFSLTDSISLANLGADFGVVGNGAFESTSSGRAYGLEFLYRQRLFKGFYGILAYTYVKSEFSNADADQFIASSWDFGHIINLSAGKRFKKGWELGFKFRYSGGAPYTPYNIAISSQKNIWDATGIGILDFTQINALRLPATHGLDVRVDKRYYFDKFSLDLYIDIQNIYAATITDRPFLDPLRDAQGKPIETSAGAYTLEEIENSSSNLLPTIGFLIDF